MQRRPGNQYLHRESELYRKNVKRKLDAYHRFVHAGIVAQGILQYLSSTFPTLVWASFGSWLRTIRPGIPPSEMVAAAALRNTLPHFLLVSPDSSILVKFIAEKLDTNRYEGFRLTG